MCLDAVYVIIDAKVEAGCCETDVFDVTDFAINQVDKILTFAIKSLRVDFPIVPVGEMARSGSELTDVTIWSQASS